MKGQGEYIVNITRTGCEGAGTIYRKFYEERV